MFRSFREFLSLETFISYVFLTLIFIFTVDETMWQEVIGMYPALLDCVTCNSNEVRYALKDALIEFRDLLSVPHNTVNIVENEETPVQNTHSKPDVSIRHDMGLE